MRNDTFVANRISRSRVTAENYDFRVAIAHSEPTVADVMLRHPKTLAADATVAEARTALESQSTHMLLLVEGERFCGAVTAIPEDADPDEPVLGFVDSSAPVVTEDTPVSAALARLEHRPSGRLVVLDGEVLVGLVCLAKDGVTFCGSPGAMG
jgi:CBS domain-containing protein